MLRVLLVEDNNYDAQIATDALEGLAEVERHLHLTSAIMAANARNFDVIVLDVSLPDSQAADTIRRFIKHAPPMPILVCSSNPETLSEYGEWVDAVLTKPISMRAIADAVRRITDRTARPYLKQSTQRLFESLDILRQIAHG